MDIQTNRRISAAFAAVFALLGLYRLYSFTQTDMLADILSGVGLLALSVGYFVTGSLIVSARGERLTGKAAAGRYLTVAGITMVVIAVVLRLMG